MFGADGERLQELRQMQARQYAEELRQQINAKNSHKPKTPAMYSTTTSDTYHAPIQQTQQTQQINNFRNALPQSVPRVNQPPPNFSFQSHSPRMLEPLPDFQATTIAPLNLTITSFQADPTPSLPRQLNRSSNFDKTEFHERIRSLESVLDQQRTVLVQSSEASSRILQNGFPSIENSVNDIQNRIDRLINTEISQRTRPVSNNATSNREALDSESRSLKNTIEEIRETFNEFYSDIPQFTAKFHDSMESIRIGCTEVKSENGRVIDQSELSLNKIAQIENRESVTNDLTSKYTNELENIDNDASSSFSSLQSSTNELMTSVSSQIAREIKVESDAREHLASALQSQVSEVNQKVVDNVSRLQGLISSMTSNFKETMTSLNDSINDALSTTQDEVDVAINDFDSKFSNFIQNVEGNFKAIQTESISTISTIKDIFTQTRDIIENSIEKESEVQKKNASEISSKFESFEVLVKREMGVQIDCLEEVEKETISKGYGIFDSIIQDAKTQMIVVNQYSDKINAAEESLNKIEKDFTTASTQVRESCRILTANYNEIAQKYEKVKNTIEDMLEDAEKNIANCAKWEHKTAAKREELIDVEKAANDLIEKKISDIESQITVALTNIAQISINNRDTRPRLAGSGVQILKKLAGEIDTVPNDDFDSSSITVNTTKTEISYEDDTFDSKQKKIKDDDSDLTESTINTENNDRNNDKNDYTNDGNNDYTYNDTNDDKNDYTNNDTNDENNDYTNNDTNDDKNDYTNNDTNDDKNDYTNDENNDKINDTNDDKNNKSDETESKDTGNDDEDSVIFN